MKIAFIGMGQMGKNIALNIVKHGFDVTVWNRKDAFWPNVEEAVRAGAKAAASIADAVAGADVVGLSLTSDAAVSSVLAEAVGALKKGAVVVDFSTTSPKCSKDMKKLLADIPADFLDAPVSGGMEGAAAGTLTVMVGGDRASYDKVLPVLQAMGKNIHHMGPNGAGQVTKLINQILTGVNQAMVCEAMVVAAESGLDMNQLFGVLTTAWGTSRMLERSVPQYIIPQKYESAACLELMIKDLGMALKMADDMGVALPLTQLAKHYYDAAGDAGQGKMDHSYVIEIMKQENKRKAGE
jgi:3-hydroxyisobutyrate dehydrogenase-like beta-hydroxyacid dehydrogenase